MSQKDYKAIAEIIKEAKSIRGHKTDNIEVRHIISGLINVFKADNPLFNPEKFKKAVYS